MTNFLNFNKPKTITQWIIFLAAVGITLSSPSGTRAFTRELNKELNKYLTKKFKEDEISIKPIKVSQALYRLKKRKIIEFNESDNKTIIVLTENGKKRKLQYDLESIVVSKPKSWDRKWRLLMFDIPEPLKKAREALRIKLKQLGFFPFQKSVWIYPYPCENEIDFISEVFSVAPNIALLTVEIENDEPLREFFNL